MPSIGIGPFRIGISKRGNVYWGIRMPRQRRGRSYYRRTSYRTSSSRASAKDYYPRCMATTKKGTQCTRSGKYNGYCLPHYKIHQREVEAERRRRQRVLEAERKRLRNRINTLDKKLRKDPNDVSALCEKGEILEKVDEVEKGFDCYMEALKIFSNNPHMVRETKTLYEMVCAHVRNKLTRDVEKLTRDVKKSAQEYKGAVEEMSKMDNQRLGIYSLISIGVISGILGSVYISLICVGFPIFLLLLFGLTIAVQLEQKRGECRERIAICRKRLNKAKKQMEEFDHQQARILKSIN